MGASGSGKTTWVIQALEAMATGKPFLDRFTPLVPLPQTHYVCLDRQVSELTEKGIFRSIPNITYVSYQDKLRTTRIDRVVQEVPNGTKLLIIDGIGFLVDKIISQREVGIVLSDVIAATKPRGITPWLVHHTPKVKGEARYINPREKAAGSGAWAQMSAVYTAIEETKPDDVSDGGRIAWILQNNAPGIQLDLELDNGRLTPKSAEPDFLSFFEGMDLGPKELSELTGCSRRTAHRKIETALERGQLIQVERGRYQKAPL